MEVFLGYILVSRITGGGYLEIYHRVKVYWWRLSSGITQCQGLLVEVILRYILESKFTGGACLEVYHGVNVY